MQDSAEQLKLYGLLVDGLGLMCVHDLDGVLRFIIPLRHDHSDILLRKGLSPEDGLAADISDFFAPSVRHLLMNIYRIRREPTHNDLIDLVGPRSERAHLVCSEYSI